MVGAGRRGDGLRGRVVGGWRDGLDGGGPGAQRHGDRVQPHRPDRPHDLLLPGAGAEGHGAGAVVSATTPEPVPALPLAGAIGLGVLLLGLGRRALHARGRA